MTLARKKIAEVRERLKAATPGPYAARVREFSNRALSEIWTEFGWYQQLPRDYREPTTEMLAHAPADLDKLCQALELALEAFGDIERNADPYSTSERVARKALAKIDEVLSE